MRYITRQEWYGALVAVLVLGVFLSVASPFFLSGRNLSNILVQASVIALLAGGQTFVILTGGVDLAVGALTALAGAVAGYMMVKLGINPYLAILAAFGIGAAVGLFNGYLVAFVGIPAFIVTLGGLTLWRGLAFESTGGFDMAGLPEPFPFIGNGELLGIPMPIIVMALFYGVMGFILSSTKLGRYVYAIGSNEEATRLSGINVDNWKVAVYTLSGFFIGMCALFYAAAYTTITPGTGAGQEMNGITGVIIGGTSMSGGSGTMVGTLIGVFIMSVLKTGLANCGLQAPWQTFLTGAVVIGAVLLDIARTKAANRVKKG